MVGSFGYSAPEFAMSGIYTVKSDVYSFGVVMLELLTGRKPLDRSISIAMFSLLVLAGCIVLNLFGDILFVNFLFACWIFQFQRKIRTVSSQMGYSTTS